MTKRELAQRLLLAWVESGAAIQEIHYDSAARAVCKLTDALHAEMDQRREADGHAEGAARDYAESWDA